MTIASSSAGHFQIGIVPNTEFSLFLLLVCFCFALEYKNYDALNFFQSPCLQVFTLDLVAIN